MKSLQFAMSRIGCVTAVNSFHSSASASRKRTLDLAGIYPPIPTNFDRQENIDSLALKENMKKWNEIPFRGYVVEGSNGEYVYMTDRERVNLVATVKKMIPNDKLLIGGSGCESTRSTIDMTNRMADAGADAALVVTPSYYKSAMTDDAMLAHYTKVADHSGIPVILYSAPSCTAIDLSADVVTKLSLHPNIIGLKDSGGDISKLGLIVHQTQERDFQVLAGSASFLYAAYQLGCAGGIVALANILGEECCRLQQHFQLGEWADAEELQKRLILPNTDVTRKYGVPGLKYAMDLLGYNGGATRLPLLPLSENDAKILTKYLKKGGFL